MLRITLFIVFLSTLLFGNKDILIIDSKNNIYDNFKISYFKDYNNTLKIENIEKVDFKEVSTNNFSLGYTNINTWIKIDILNISENSDFILTLDENFYEKANLYYKNGNQWKKEENGIFKKIDTRDVQYHKLSFKLKLPKNRENTIFIELQSKYLYFGKLIIYDENTFNTKKVFDSTNLYILTFGISLVIIIFTIGLSIIFKEKIYYYYTAYTFFNAILLIRLSGILTYFDLQMYTYTLNMTSAYINAFLILFSLEYLETRKYMPDYHNYLRLLVIPYILIGFMFFFQYNPWNIVVNYASLLTFLLLLYLSIYTYIRGNKKSIYYTIALLSYMTFAVVFILMLSGLLKYNFLTRHAMAIGSIIENIFFLILIVNRYYTTKEKELQSQKNLIAMQDKQKLLLQEEVDSRTEELKESNTKLQNFAKERELLLKEVLHRVKNNFHTVLAMIWFESEKYQDKSIFENITSRIDSMSKINEYLLYNSNNLHSIDADKYLKNIISNGINIHQDRDIKVDIEIDNITFNFETILSIGAILNELLSNSIRHSESENLTFDISLKKESDYITFKVSDNGKGFDYSKTKAGLGLNLIKDFSKNLPKCKIDFINDNGAIFILKFKAKERDELL